MKRTLSILLNVFFHVTVFAQADCAPYLPQRMTLLRSEFDSLALQFDEHFRCDNHEGIEGSLQEVLWTDIYTQAMAVVNADDVGVILRYGADDCRFVLGLSFVPMHESDTVFRFDTEAEVYAVVGRRLSTTPISLNSWQREFVDHWWPLNNGRYFSDVEIQRNNYDNYKWVDRGTDAEMEVVPFHMELKRLYDDNAMLVGDQNQAYVVFRCISRYEKSENRYMHRIGMFIRTRPQVNPESGYRDLLDNSARNPNHCFRLHGADLGNLCPPETGCGMYVRQGAK